MIKIENAQTMNWEAAIRGARNPMNSWEKSDSKFLIFVDGENIFWHTINGDAGCDNFYEADTHLISEDVEIGPNDLKLLSSLAKAGSDEAKFRRMITVSMDIAAPMYWWKEFDTYKVGTVRNSCSTMHKIHAKEFTLDDFSTEHLMNMHEASNHQIGDLIVCDVDYEKDPTPYVRENMCCTLIGTDEYFQPFSPKGVLMATIDMLNRARELYLQTKDKKYWWQMIQLLPSSYNQKATITLNYEVLANIYHARKFHKLDEWREFCAWIETLPYTEELIVDAGHEDTEDQLRARFKSYENRIKYLEITMAKELFSMGMSTLDISEKIGMGESTVIKIVEEV